MKDTYAVLGAGMQGTAAAYDLVRFANPDTVYLADMSLEQAQQSAARVNSLLDSRHLQAGATQRPGQG